jgi:AAA+ ATPase superfamily predicted ATPase
MKKIANPFMVYGYAGPDYFCDREVETAQLCSALYNGRNVTLISPRRMGKTGLIHHAFFRIRQDNPAAVCFYMDIFSTTSLSDFVIQFGQTVIGKLDTFPQKTLGALASLFKNSRLVFSADPLNGMPQVTLSFQPEQATNTLKEIFDYLKQADRECYIAIDEFQQITEYPETGVEGLLRSYIQFLPNVHFIFSGSKQHLMAEMFGSAKRPFYHSTEKMGLLPISQDSYFRFAEQWMNTAGKQLSAALFSQIYQRFEGHTWYVQYILNRLYGQPDKKITAETARQCVEHIILSEKEVYQQLYSLLTENQSSLLHAIASEQTVTSINSVAFIKKYNLKATSSINTALRFLIKKEYIYKSGNAYQVYDRFMALWLQALPHK